MAIKRQEWSLDRTKHEKETKSLKYRGRQREHPSWWIVYERPRWFHALAFVRRMFGIMYSPCACSLQGFSCFFKSHSAWQQTSASYIPTFSSVWGIKGWNRGKAIAPYTFDCASCQCYVGSVGHECGNVKLLQIYRNMNTKKFNVLKEIHPETFDYY